MSRDHLLLIGDTVRDADMLYAVGMFVPDPFIYLAAGRKPVIVMNDSELNRARREASHCRVLSLSRCMRQLKRDGTKQPGLAHVAAALLRAQKIKKILVPRDFPLGLARKLEQLKIRLKVAKGPFFRNREIKNAAEVKMISAALVMAEVGMSEAIQALRLSKIGKNKQLIRHGVPLTAQKLRSIIEVAVLQAGGIASQTIVACGQLACDPHEPGHGPIKANEPIVMDIFPRSQRTAYFGDITRTVVRGRASDALRKIYHTVAHGQEIAFRQMRHAGVCRDIHRSVQDCFTKEGFKTVRRNHHVEGFFHGTGHGLGLELHESPRINANSKEALFAGNVVTNEPGLYYPGIGGVRLEDVVLVTRNGPKNLTKFEKVLEV